MLIQVSPHGRESLAPRWQQNAFQTVSFTVPETWQAGRIWVSVELPEWGAPARVLIQVWATAGPPQLQLQQRHAGTQLMP